MEKRCSKCEKLKDIEEFYKRTKDTKDGYEQRCKECLTEYHREWFKKNKKGRKLKYNYEIGSKEYRKTTYLKCVYKISLEQYNELFDKQGGCCAICGLHQSNMKKSLQVDHDHKTGRIRGLLCWNCNLGIGRLMDSKEILLSAVKYLE